MRKCCCSKWFGKIFGKKKECCCHEDANDIVVNEQSDQNSDIDIPEEKK